MSTPENEVPADDNEAAEPSEPTEPIEVLTPEQTRIRELEGKVSAAEDAAQQAQARLRAVSKAFTELQGDFKAFRERQEALKEVIKRDQAFSLTKAFFDPVMNLKRSLQTLDDVTLDESFANGLRLVHHQFMEAMSKLGLEEVPGEGAPFDPKVHEALAVTPVTDPEQDGRILTVHAVGYVVNGQVLQPAQVVVGKLHETDSGEA